eukprot:TRINITY_DN1469_c0_g1_i1.p1 TRINITY_DN1469_c0_g1~~TRINITY_DN1469_c0_g1_i1.p1  ORF type:complete len:528 (+),score=163.97 TRINITY_DN1469_c0_g1_i1:129-1712(+)
MSDKQGWFAKMKQRWGNKKKNGTLHQEIKNDQVKENKIDDKNNNGEEKVFKQEIEVIIADSIEDLPKEIYEKVKKLNFSTDLLNKNLNVLFNVLHFKYKHIFRTNEQHEKIMIEREKKKKEKQEKRDEIKETKVSQENLEISDLNNTTTTDNNNTNTDKEDSPKLENKKSSQENIINEPKIEGIKLDRDLEDNLENVGVKTNERQKDLVMFLAGGDNAINRNQSGQSHVIFEGEKLAEVLPDERVIKKLFKLQDEEGKGGFGIVCSAKDLTSKKKVAIKKMKHANTKECHMNYSEIYFLNKCKHANIVAYNKAYVLPTLQEMWVVMEFLEGGTLSQAVKGYTFKESQVAYSARELLKAIKFIHENGVCHRDIKSANVMMSIKGQIKLIDFGLCKSMEDGPTTHMLGSPFWIPPEMIQKKPHSYPTDIWSFAICMMELCEGNPPNCSSSLKAMFLVGIGQSPKLEKMESWSETVIDFLDRCLEIDPEKRSTAAQLLQHPFCQKADTQKSMEQILQQIFLQTSLAMQGF